MHRPVSCKAVKGGSAWRPRRARTGTTTCWVRTFAHNDHSPRQLAAMTNVSNAYLSQIERGLHQPSVKVLRSIATALNLSGETLLAQAGLVNAEPRATKVAGDTEA